MPDNGAFLWDWFWELRQAQPSGFSGPVPISNGELALWCQLTGNIVRREEVAILKSMDARFSLEVEKENDAIRARDAT
ncbi:phage tail assembly chaperone [Sinorhizobium meliloti]|uniref:phage tail assembly chaperone n=1 Tax=Rhizobium meliloti TaxID=382 RepID=UPI003F1419CB